MSAVRETTIKEAQEALEAFLRSGADKQTLSFSVHNGIVKTKVTQVVERLSPRKMKAHIARDASGERLRGAEDKDAVL